jgi:acetyltransferase-like isoleucine patch superfamily enzyme
MSYVIKYILLNVLGPLIPHPKLRSWYLRLLGAKVGRRVRIENVRFIQIQGEIANLQCAHDAFIRSGVTIDLSARLSIGRHAIVSPGCSLITHQDFGEFNGNALARHYPKTYAPIVIGDNVVIGSDTTVLAGTEIESFTVVGAKSLVRGRLAGNSLFVGAPARFVRRLSVDS